MAGYRTLFAILFLISYVSSSPTPQGCGPSMCCLRRGAPNLRCEGQSASDYRFHTQNFVPSDVFQGGTWQAQRFDIVFTTVYDPVRLGSILLTLNPDTNQYRSTFDQNQWGRYRLKKNEFTCP